MFNKLVSIIIPAYNCETSIAYAIKSVLLQSYQNIELIVINDGSTDNTLLKIKKIAKNNDKIKVISQNNKGVSEARNNGIKVSKGTYIMFLDADDILNKNALESLINGFKYEIDLAVGSFFEINGEIKSEHLLPIEKDLVFNLNNIPEEFYINGFFHPCWGKLYLSKIIKENNIMFPSQRLSEDSMFNCAYLKHCKKIYLTKESVYIYQHINNNSLTRQIDKDGLDNYIVLHHSLNELIDTDILYQTMFSLYYSQICKVLNSKVAYNEKKEYLNYALSQSEIFKTFQIPNSNKKTNYILNKMIEGKCLICIILLRLVRIVRIVRND